MDKYMKAWQGLVSLILLLITIGTAVVSQSNKIETQALRISYLESMQRDQTLQFKEINGRLTEILVALQNKQNKK